jgi:uncharacterized protein (TIGR02996 family)
MNPEPELTEAERERLAAVAEAPYWSTTSGGARALYWYRRTATGTQWQSWEINGDDELRQAVRFYEMANRIGPYARRVPPGEPHPRTSDEKALVAGILANCDEDTGYLVYADYLTERGDSQGDFSRACVEWHRANPEPDYDGDDYQALVARAAERAEEWYAPLLALGARPTDRDGQFAPNRWLSFRRGVIDQVSIDTPDLLPRNAERLFAAVPFLRKLDFARGQFDGAGLAQVPQMAQIEEIRGATHSITGDELARFLKSPHLRALKCLNFIATELGDVGAEALAAWPGLARVEELLVWSCDIGEHGMRALARAPNLRNVQRLDVGRNQAAESAIPELLASPHLGAVLELVLSGYTLTPALAAQFGTVAFRNALAELDLSYSAIQEGALAALGKVQLPALRSLVLDSATFDYEYELGDLPEADFAATLAELDLSSCELQDALDSLLRPGAFPKLRVLKLGFAELSSAGVELLAETRLPALERLDLCSTSLNEDDVELLAASPLFETLTELELQYNAIGEAGARALALSPHLGNLKRLTVDGDAVGDAGKRALLDRFGERAVSFR